MLLTIAREKILLADSTKFHTVDFAEIADIDVLDAIISDNGINEYEILKALSDEKVKLFIAI